MPIFQNEKKALNKILIYFSFPWNQQTPIGYIFELILDIASAEGYWIGCGSLLLLFISINLHHRAFFEMFRHLLRDLDQFDQHKDQHLFHKLIQFHKSVKE